MDAFKSLDGVNQLISGWTDTVYFHEINKRSLYCYLRCSVRPSQKVSEKPHLPIVVVEKTSGKVKHGICTCMAGLGNTCSHVAALLFKVELAVRLGKTNPSCTSLACEWNVGTKKAVNPAEVKDISKTIKKHPKTVCVEEPEIHYDHHESVDLVKRLNDLKVSLQGSSCMVLDVIDEIIDDAKGTKRTDDIATDSPAAVDSSSHPPHDFSAYTLAGVAAFIKTDTLQVTDETICKNYKEKLYDT